MYKIRGNEKYIIHSDLKLGKQSQPNLRQMYGL